MSKHSMLTHEEMRQIAFLLHERRRRCRNPDGREVVSEVTYSRRHRNIWWLHKAPHFTALCGFEINVCFPGILRIDARGRVCGDKQEYEELFRGNGLHALGMGEMTFAAHELRDNETINSLADFVIGQFDGKPVTMPIFECGPCFPAYCWTEAAWAVAEAYRPTGRSQCSRSVVSTEEVIHEPSH